MALRGDYAAGYRALRRILALGEARGYEPDTSQARFLFALLSCWFEPIENGVRAARRAREGLIAGGDLANAGYTYYADRVLTCWTARRRWTASSPRWRRGWPSCAVPATSRPASGSTATGGWLGVLRGDSSAAAGEAVHADRYADNPLALLHAHVTRALAAAIFGDPAGLARHTAAAMPLLPAALGALPDRRGHLLRGLALAGQARASRR